MMTWTGLAGYLGAGVFLGLLLVSAAAVARGSAAPPPTRPGVVTDNVVHVRPGQIASQCWRSSDRESPARVTVALEVGLDGKVRLARAAGESAAMRACVESYVKAWEFLPQASPSQMVLPVEIDPE